MMMRKFNRDKVPRPDQYFHFGQWNTLQAGLFDLEVGCGVGLQPIQYVSKNPERKMVAIEHTYEKFQKFKSRYQGNKSPKNLLGIHGNAISIITHEIPNQSVENCFFLYPNPEPKNKAKRWMSMPFFSEILRVLTSNGKIILSTNIESYIQEALEIANSELNLKCEIFGKVDLQDPLTFDHILPEDTRYPRTHFEKKYLDRNQNCYQAIWVKKP